MTCQLRKEEGSDRGSYESLSSIIFYVTELGLQCMEDGVKKVNFILATFLITMRALLLLKSYENHEDHVGLVLEVRRTILIKNLNNLCGNF